MKTGRNLFFLNVFMGVIILLQCFSIVALAKGAEKSAFVMVFLTVVLFILLYILFNIHVYRKSILSKAIKTVVPYEEIAFDNTDECTSGAILDSKSPIEEIQNFLKKIDFDTLTGLLSKSTLIKKSEKMINEDPDKCGAMVFIDLDNLKYINDNFGHELGDKYLIEAGQIFKYFEKYGGISSRISGDEFAIYIHGYKEKEELWDIIKGIYPYSKRFGIQTPDGRKNRIRFSAGVAWYPDDADSVMELLKLSDFALYEAKHKEKGHLFNFNKEYYDKTSYLFKNREAINRLIDESLIRYAFQPIVDLKTGEVYGYEVLMRSLIDDFKNALEILTVASAQSKLTQLEQMLVLKAYQTVEENKDIIKNRKIFINSIPHHRISEKDEKFITERYSSFFGQIVVEIIEQEDQDGFVLKKKAEYFKEKGIQIAIDDFGNGYSNELRILSISPEIIKIDMELIQGINFNKDKQEIVSNIIEFSHQRGIKIIAEGIEEKDDLIKIINMGLDYAQGYYLGKPSFKIAEIDENIKKEILESN